MNKLRTYRLIKENLICENYLIEGNKAYLAPPTPNATSHFFFNIFLETPELQSKFVSQINLT